jgi:hypothetical protein
VTVTDGRQTIFRENRLAMLVQAENANGTEEISQFTGKKGESFAFCSDFPIRR